jgi:hypothetical protein
VVEHSTADREVPGSNPGAPSPLFIFFIHFFKMQFIFVHIRILITFSAMKSQYGIVCFCLIFKKTK